LTCTLFSKLALTAMDTDSGIIQTSSSNVSQAGRGADTGGTVGKHGSERVERRFDVRCSTHLYEGSSSLIPIGGKLYGTLQMQKKEHIFTILAFET
jgi:hypothetical protein